MLFKFYFNFCLFSTKHLHLMVHVSGFLVIALVLVVSVVSLAFFDLCLFLTLPLPSQILGLNISAVKKKMLPAFMYAFYLLNEHGHKYFYRNISFLTIRNI